MKWKNRYKKVNFAFEGILFLKKYQKILKFIKKNTYKNEESNLNRKNIDFCTTQYRSNIRPRWSIFDDNRMLDAIYNLLFYLRIRAWNRIIILGHNNWLLFNDDIILSRRSSFVPYLNEISLPIKIKVSDLFIWSNFKFI